MEDKMKLGDYLVAYFEKIGKIAVRKILRRAQE
jgi:hypothetical protein